jgi:WD40 repeat protein
MPGAPLRKVRIFVSSPVDVAPERGRVQAAAAKLTREYAGLVEFETVLWEEHFYTADRSYQPQIPEPIACDIVVSIFWTRIGTELPTEFPRMPNGQPYPSGTAYELLTALEASKGRSVPDVYVFRKTADAVLSTSDAERRRQAETQFRALEAFWSEWFKTEKGQFKAAFQSFGTTDGFEQQVELLLRHWLEAHGVLGPRMAWPQEKGSPFPGLASFEAEHAAVFFGRDRQIDEARRRLAAAAERGTPFLLIVGASGSGKSSLARAGLIPRITTPGVVEFVDLFRVARMKPADGHAGPLVALATALFDPGALPELAQGDYPTAAVLADNLARGGAASVQPVVRALARAAQDVQRERHSEQAMKPALVLLIDQFEELFAAGLSDSERAAFSAVVQYLVASGRVWVVATLRADLYELLLMQPELKALKETGASLDLGPPGPAELAEIVRAPAEAAGLAFEANAENGLLDERLLADAKTADSLPLLQFTLRQLYERRVEAAGKTQMTHAAYDALGGLAGAIAAEAERAVSGLPPKVLASLPRLMRLLAEPARDGKALTLREVAQAEAAAEALEAALLAALVKAHILIARTDAEGRPTVRLAHDAVLSSWPRAREAAQASREFYRVRAEVEDALRRWQQYGRRKDRLINPGVPLAEAEKLVGDFRTELPAELIGYVRASRNRARRQQRLVAASAVFFFVLAIAATGAGILAYRAQQEAVRAEARAVAALTQAKASLWVANSRSDLRDGRVASAIDYAAKAFKELPSETSRSVAVSALLELSPHLRASFDIGSDGAEAVAWTSPDSVAFAPAKAGAALRTLAVSKPSPSSTAKEWQMPQVTRVQDGNRAAVRAIRTVGPDRVMAVLDNGALALIERGATAAHVWAPSQPTTLHATAHAAAIGRSGTLILAANNDSDVAVIDCTLPASPQASMDCRERPLANVRGKAVAIGADETRFAVADEAGSVSIYDRTGLRLGEPMQVGGSLLALGWANARDWLAAGNANGDIVVFDVATPARPQIAKASFAGSPITTLAWSPGGLELAFVCDHGTVCLWPSAGTAGGVARFAPIRRLEGHAIGATSLAWSPAGDQFASASGDGTLRVWSLAQVTDAGLTLYAESAVQLAKVATSPDGRWVAGGAKDGTIRIWDAMSGALLRTPKSSYDAEVAALAWSRSGLLAAAHESQGITLVPADARESVRELAVDTDLDTRIVLAEDDKTIALPQHGDKRIALIDVAASDVRTRRYLDPIGPDQAPWGLAVDPSGKTLFATYTEANGEIHVWDLATRKSSGRMAYTFREKRDPIAGGSLSVSPDGRWLATSGGDKYIRVYDIRTKSSWRALPMDFNAEPYTVAFSPDGTMLAALAADNRVYVWSLREDGAERYASFKGVPDRTRVADRETREQLATWLAWVTNDSIALATGASAINVILLDPAKWQGRIDRVAPVAVPPVN